MKDIVLPKTVDCGYFDSKKHFGSFSQSPRRTVQKYEIELYLSDGGATYINGRRVEIRKDYFVITKPGYERYSILPFETVFIRLEAQGELAAVLDNLPDYFFALHSRRFRELLHEMIVMNESGNVDRLILGSNLLKLISYLERDARADMRGVGLRYKMMHEAKRYIEQHFQESISGEDIARSVNLSESRLRYLFKLAYGYSPHRYLTDVRIAAAKELLWNTDIPISDISESCGFGCQQYLNEVFKKNVGVSPGEYRKNFSDKYLL